VRNITSPISIVFDVKKVDKDDAPDVEKTNIFCILMKVQALSYCEHHLMSILGFKNQC
jgi:GTP cyclohydrolase I